MTELSVAQKEPKDPMNRAGLLRYGTAAEILQYIRNGISQRVVDIRGHAGPGEHGKCECRQRRHHRCML